MLRFFSTASSDTSIDITIVHKMSWNIVDTGWSFFFYPALLTLNPRFHNLRILAYREAGKIVQQVLFLISHIIP